MKITQRTWEQLDLPVIAELTRSAYRIEGRGDYTLQQIERYLKNLNERFPIEVAMIAVEGERTAGWIGLERKTKNIGEIGRWHPYVCESSNRDDIALELIEEVMKYASAHGMNRLEIGFNEISDSNLKAYENRCSWLSALGWNLVEDTCFMTMDSLEDYPIFTVPEKFQMHPLLSVDDNELFKCHDAAFSTSEAREYYDLSKDEKKQHFTNLYDRSQNINSEASIVLKNDNNLVGILLVVSRDSEEHITVLAVHPHFRGRGLAKAMLSASLKELREQGIQNLSIGVDIVNTPAIQLYQKYGFHVTSRLSFFSWKSKPR